jgi:hypothetical protein
MDRARPAGFLRAQWEALPPEDAAAPADVEGYGRMEEDMNDSTGEGDILRELEFEVETELSSVESSRPGGDHLADHRPSAASMNVATSTRRRVRVRAARHGAVCAS